VKGLQKGVTWHFEEKDGKEVAVLDGRKENENKNR